MSKIFHYLPTTTGKFTSCIFCVNMHPFCNILIDSNNIRHYNMKFHCSYYQESSNQQELNKHLLALPTRLKVGTQLTLF